MKKTLAQGFTLIELLIVITILGILATVVIAALNPLRKINLANDAKIKSDISAIAKAAQISTVSIGGYASTQAILLAGGDIGTTWPTGPGGVTYLYKLAPASPACSGSGCTSASVYSSKLFAPVNNGFIWCWQSSTGMAQEVVNAAACQP